MFKPLAAAILVAAVAHAAEAAAAPPLKPGICPGLSVSGLEQRFAPQAQSYPFEGAMVQPFLELWQSRQRPKLPVAPEHVTVYALPGKPYLIGYQRRGCVIAFLAVKRQALLRWLRPRLGWPV